MKAFRSALPAAEKRPDHLCRNATFSLLKDTGDSYVDAKLSYRADDPYAVTVTFFTAGRNTIEWSFARDLLAAGLREHAGLGDIRISPTAGKRNSTTLTLDNSRQCAVLTTSTTTLAAFLHATRRLVPVGEEHEHLEVEGMLTELLASEIE